MIVYTPLDLPNIEPDNWDVFWKIWNEHSKSLIKTRMNHSLSESKIGAMNLWEGLDVYIKGYNYQTWQAPFYDIRKDLPNMFEQIENFELKNISRVRLISSNLDINSHTDDNIDQWQIRGFFHYPSTRPQWYFTKPTDKDGERTYIMLPKDSIWFSYNDKYCWHGSTYEGDNKKILIQIYFSGPVDKLLERSKEKYKNYTITYE